MNLTKFTSRAAAALVAGVAGFSSYQHIVSVATHAGEHGSVAVVLPLAIDGLIVVGTMAMIEDKRAGRLPRQSARFALAFGIVATLAANIASAQPTWTARMVAAVPAISFLIAVEVLARTGRPRPVSADVAPSVAARPAEAPATAADSVVTSDAPVSSRPRTSRRKTGRKSAADRVAAAARRTPHATAATLAGRLGLSERTVQRHLDALSVDKMPPPQPLSAQVNGHMPALDDREEVTV